ncbi:hypothetical protein CNR22_10350 [Sphingobacteriaceae bacterium]|nr:hypothetical protein CNR22_10350 [Sphingobacteriaceae bacterium]
MKKIFFLAALSSLIQLCNAQNSFNCSSHEMYLNELKSNPAFKINQQQLEKETETYLERISSARPNAASYVIPVVFHVIYTTNAGNISDAQIVDQIAILNEEFNRQQPDTVLTPAAFKSAAAPFSVEFRLATIDPNGKCTNGINRIYNSLTNCSFAQDDVKSLSYWPSNMYLNIWITQSMHYSGSLDCSGGGYATFPGGSSVLDGINIRGDLISNIGTAATNTSWGNFKGRYLIHELGHWFNLRHIWGDATCGNDFVADTPPAEASNGGCPTFPHNAFSSCSGSNGDGEMFTNYMDYTNGPCLNMFTSGQVARMTACITSAVGGRSNLWSPANLNATGVSSPYTYPVACVSNPAILPYGTLVVCKGDSVRFTDNSYGGNSTSRSWSFPGGSASSLTDSIVKVKYNAAGLYTVALTKNYQSTSKTETFIDKVQVLETTSNINYSAPFSEGFEDGSTFDTDWVVVNSNQDVSKWEVITTTGYNGSNCVGIMNFGKSAPLTDDLISPAYDLSTISSPTLTFRLHFSKVVTANTDRLVVSISSNCGKSWQQLYSRNGISNLSTVTGNISSSNIPPYNSDEDWRLEKINMMTAWANGTVRFKFAFTSGGGNNIFIDDINIDGVSTTGLTKISSSAQITLVPNPAKDELQIKVGPNTQTSSEIEIFDIMGKLCLLQKIDKSKENGSHINISTLENGVYFVRVKQADNTVYTKKFIKQDF